MFGRIFVLALMAAGAPATVSAQNTVEVDYQAVLLACQTRVADCQDVVAQMIAEIGASGLNALDRSNALALLAGAVLQAARTNSDASDVYAATMREIAAAAVDPRQANSIQNVAALIESNQIRDVEVEVLAASPA